MASRFFMSDSESDSGSDSEEILRESGPVIAFTFSDDEEEQSRTVRSAKEKKYEHLNIMIRDIKNCKKNRDISNLLINFEELCKAYQKALLVIMKEEEGKTPRFYLRYLVELEDFINSSWNDKDWRKNISKNNTKSLTTLRQKFRKYCRDMMDDMNMFREQPDDESEEDKEDSETEEDEDDVEPVVIETVKKEPSILKEVKKKDIQQDSDNDSFDWPTDSEDSSESEGDRKAGPINTRDRFLKAPEAAGKSDDLKKERMETKRKLKREQKEESEDDDQEGWQKVNSHGVPMERPKMFAKDDEITIPSVMRKLFEIMAARGKRGTDRKVQIELLHELYNIAKENTSGEAVLVKIFFNLINSIYDYNPNLCDPMKVDFWEKVLVKIEELLQILLAATSDLSIGDHIIEEEESFEEAPFKISGSIVAIIERMDEEFTKILKDCDSHSNEYVIRLQDEKKICRIIDSLLDYEEKNGLPADKCRIYLRKIEHMYYKYDELAIEQVKVTNAGSEVTSLIEMDRLCKYIYVSDTTDRLRTRAVLCQIYHKSLHNHWYEARDQMFMTHLQETIHHSDIPTQLLYNRTMVQLGLCAFRHGHIKESHDALLDVQSGGRAKELLAQGLLPQRQYERTSDQEKLEKQRQIPFHQHINLEMLECVYLVSAMLTEVPYMAAHELDGRRRMISKSFHYQLKNSERQALIGPPESMREHVVAASKAMRNGKWLECRNLILNPKMNAKVWNLFHESNDVTEMLGKKIQEESLRTYLFTYSRVYDSISLEILSDTFNLPYGTVHAIISKLIINEEIMASLDEPSKCLVLHKTEPSALQSLSLQLSDKLHNLIENNERVLEKPFFNRGMQGMGYRDRQKIGWYDRNDRRDNRRD